jgi:hypothetical protein
MQSQFNSFLLTASRVYSLELKAQNKLVTEIMRPFFKSAVARSLEAQVGLYALSSIP